MQSFRGLASWSLQVLIEQVAASWLAREEELGPSGAVPLIFLPIGLAHTRVWAQVLTEYSCTAAAPPHLHREEQGGKGKPRIIQGWLCYSILCNEWV